jgi:hypothetical protein
VRIVDVGREMLGDIDEAEAVREGFPSVAAFGDAWKAINGSFDLDDVVWRVEFVAVPAEDLPLWERAA